MNDDTDPKPKPSSREAQRAEALRQNLLRRKAQARERAAPAEPLPPKSAAEP